MGVLDKCCGNCKHFKDENADGKGICTNPIEGGNFTTFCSVNACRVYESIKSGWAEITTDNMVELYQVADRLVVHYNYFEGHAQTDMANRFAETISTMAKLGGYYYFVLPELKLEK